MNNQLVKKLEKKGLVISGRSPDNHLIEMIELSSHPWYVGCQFHPEFTSTPRLGHPLFKSYVQAAISFSDNRQYVSDEKLHAVRNNL